MRIDRMLPVGLLVTAGIGVGCGDIGTSTSTTETSSALAARKVNPFEARVREKKELSDPDLMPPAGKTDATLVNAWGIALDPKTGLAWISSNGAGTAEVVDEDGNFQKSVILPDGSAPTGDVFNPSHSFKGDDFIFATENGTIIGVKRDQLTSDPPRFPGPDGSNFKGVTIAKVHGKDRLLIADFGDELPDGSRSFGGIVVLDDDYKPMSDGKFIDPELPSDFSPFNVMADGDLVFVTYAQHSDDDFHDDAHGAGLGLVVLFTTDGKFVTELVKNGAGSVLNAPWGMALKRDKDDRKAPDLVVGNFGDGAINVFDLSLSAKNATATFDGALATPFGQPLIIQGLWGIVNGNGRGGFDPGDIYFCAGPNDENDGLFGELDFVTPRR
jgi:uncharacterized protein (TIGR03118 family)